MIRLFCATSNPGKLREFRMAVAPEGGLASGRVAIELVPDFDALGGAPGVHSARFAGAGATDDANNQLLLQKLQGVTNRAARFVCVIALVEGERLLNVFRRAVEGFITDAPRGRGGFGYDPLFYYPPFGCTFGEAPAERKFAVSHRGQALRVMLEWLSGSLFLQH